MIAYANEHQIETHRVTRTQHIHTAGNGNNDTIANGTTTCNQSYHGFESRGRSYRKIC